MKSSSKVLAPGSRFAIPLHGKATLESEMGGLEARATGEVVLLALGDWEDRRSLKIQRLVLATTPIRTKGGGSGVISVIADPAEGALRFGPRHDELEVSGPARIHYPELDEEAGIEMQKGCYYTPTFLPASFRLVGRITAVQRHRLSGKIRLVIACVAGENEAFSSLVLELEADWQRLVPSGGDVSNTGCHTSLQTNKRRLRVQPVGFRTSTVDPTPSASTAAAQIGTAAAVWDKCCIEIDANPVHLITDATLKTSSDQAAIRASYTHVDPNTIEIFFVQNPLAASGGGNAGAIGVASQKVVIAEPNGGNPVLVAHELGHALGLVHPPGSDWGTVMEPTGSAMVPGTEFVTHMMCQDISQPALQTLAETCCLEHDSGDHYIRDFPEDIGNEPSEPLPPGRTRYSMSNVWNRLANTAGTFGTNGPDHQHPARFEADGVTVKTNYLFARVEQVGTLAVRDVVVKFYLKHPGSGGGAANLTLLGQASVTGSLPQNVSLQWQVPAGTPNHSCVFAVVRSPAEPEDDPTALAWADFEALSRADNDWAQRNLDIRNAAPAGSGNTFASAPVVIRIPRELEEPMPLRIAIDARAAGGLEALTVEICGREPKKIQPGRTARFEEEGLPGRDVVIFVRGSVPPRARPGVSYSIHIEPRLGKVDLAGYTCELQVTPRHEYLAQFVDALVASGVDLAQAADLAPACRIVAKTRRAMSGGGCLTTETAAEMALDMAEDVGAAIGALKRRREARAFCLERAFEEWKRALEGNDPAEIVEGLFVLAQRLQMVAWAMLNPT